MHIEEIVKKIREFRDLRDWKQFHSPKDMAVAISAEAGELLQHFVWQTVEQSERRAIDRGHSTSVQVEASGVPA